jgi:hypothetical protein
MRRWLRELQDVFSPDFECSLIALAILLMVLTLPYCSR